MKKELVTIIIPVYNTENYLKKCLDSVIYQTYTNLEIVVVNDGSTDGSEIIIDKYLKNDSRIKYLYKNNGGLSSARNFGIDNSTGSYLIFLDSDDILELNFVETMMEISLKSNAEVVSCLPNYNGKEKSVVGDVIIMKKEEAIAAYLKGEKYFLESCCFKFYKKYIFDSIKFPLGKIHEDTFTTYKILDSVEKIAFVDYKGYIVNERPLSITRSPYTDRNFDVILANYEIYNHYCNNILFSKIAFNKYLGSIIYFILKTNNLNIPTNKQAYKELNKLLKHKQKTKIKFYPFILLYRLGLLKYIHL